MKKIILVMMLVIGVASFGMAEDMGKVQKARQSMFQVVGWDMGILASMAKGEKPFDAQTAEKAAKGMNAIAESLSGTFLEGSYDGSKVKSDINTKQALFKENLNAFVNESKNMVSAANTLDSLKAQMGKLGATCKACHDNFRTE